MNAFVLSLSLFLSISQISAFQVCSDEATNIGELFKSVSRFSEKQFIEQFIVVEHIHNF